MSNVLEVSEFHREDVRLWRIAPPRTGSRVPACNAARLSTVA